MKNEVRHKEGVQHSCAEEIRGSSNQRERGGFSSSNKSELGGSEALECEDIIVHDKEGGCVFEGSATAKGDEEVNGD